MKKDTKFKPGQSGNPESRFKPGNQHRWQPQQSGNPAGIARSRLQFEESFYAALLDRGSAEEVASLLWESARKREPWAIQAVLQRLAPESKQIKVTHGLQNETNIDYTRLSGEELDQIQRLLERARVPTGTGEDGESAPQPEGIRD
ncbi:MAG: hypothetical protein ABSG56_29420 [Bryobacteraceae bacterium]|jgi:hypothetical protein